jgi:hypothetical protein
MNNERLNITQVLLVSSVPVQTVVRILTSYNRPGNKDKTWSESFKEGLQYFGIFLLTFEWGTTWPFYMPSVPVQEIPFHEEIGMVIRVRRSCIMFRS